MRLPIVEGTVEIDGLSAPARVVRDRWGVPHVVAQSRDDVFLAQGFVQAQDRLFQMDLWRRSAQGRLAEVLGANFIERDAMTRRLQYHGDVEAEWASYGADTKAIAESFVRGVNAWVARARARPPELFVLAGWLPDFWRASDLLTRTDVFDRQATIDAAERAGLPAVVVDAVRRAAVPPFFTGLAAQVRLTADAIQDVRLKPDTTKDRAANDRSVRLQADPLPSPSPRYLIHLHTPNWNAIGATAPWRPGIAVGHDGVTTWERADALLRATVHVEPLDAAAGRIMPDTIVVKGRTEPFAFETRVTARGVVIATDRAAGKQFTLDWEGFRPGRSPAFASLALRQNAPAAMPTLRQAQGRPEQGRGTSRGQSTLVLFEHPLAITDAARARFNIGPLNRPAERDATFRVMWDPKVWDASRAMNAPGQSEWVDSSHYADLAALWSSGDLFPLVYSDGAVTVNAESTLTLVPGRRR